MIEEPLELEIYSVQEIVKAVVRELWVLRGKLILSIPAKRRFYFWLEYIFLDVFFTYQSTVE